MKLYLGGAFQGQRELAEKENPGAEFFFDFQDLIRRAMAREGFDAADWAERFYRAHPNAVLVSDEIGSGVVPLSGEDRAWREAHGRVLCLLAGRCESLTRAVCGQPQRIK